MHFGEKAEKKVEYIELIYDLIFVYLIGRSNALLHTMEGGFFTAPTYLNYLLSSLVILQIWYFSTLFINRYGSNGVSDHIGLFINMYLLYYMAEGTRSDWSGYYARYNVAWGLILVNLSVQYFLRLRKSDGMMPWETRHLKFHGRLLLLQAAVIFCSIPVYHFWRLPLSWLSLLVGFAAVIFTWRIDALVPVNFEHLTERVMLYVVFTFGETIISIAGYFVGDFSLRTAYFSLMAFLVVAGLFLSYGFLYNHVIDRERMMVGNGYMMLHILLILALSGLTAALEFMPEPEVSELPKNVFLVACFLVYYLAMFLIGNYAKEGLRAGRRYVIQLCGIALAFVVLMGLFYRNGAVSILISAVFVYAIFGMIVHRYHAVSANLNE